MELVTFFNKWLHLVSIVGVLGGTAFALLVMAPLLRNEAKDSPLAKGMWKRFASSIAILWIIVLVTGFVNLFMVSHSVNSSYQSILGIKVLLALLMFVLSVLLAHPIPAVARFVENRSTWLMTLMIIGIAILGLSAHLNISRVTGAGLKSPATTAASTPATPSASAAPGTSMPVQP